MWINVQNQKCKLQHTKAIYATLCQLRILIQRCFRDIRNCQEKGYVGEEQRIALKNRRPRFVSGQKYNILE